MIYEIVDKIKEQFSKDVVWADLFAGLSKTLVRNITSVDGKLILKKFPVYENDKTACKTGDYIDLVPNTNNKGIIYFKERSTSNLGNLFGLQSYESMIRCIAWVNLKKINVNYKTANILQSDLIANLPRKVACNGVSKINISSAIPVEKSVSIFSDYTYSEENNQYLMYPYDYFAFDFTVQWSLNKFCENVELNPDVCK